MGTKRQHDEEHGAGGSGKRQKSYVGKKRKAQDDSGGKKRARAIERALRRNEKLPANVRNDLERELASQKQMAEDKALRQKRSTMISRYHMVRFFERKKASRLVKQLTRMLELETDPSQATKLSRDVHIAQVDEAYTRYFPHLETYVGLYGANVKGQREDGDGAGQAVAKTALEAERPLMWSVVEKAMEEGEAALERLRDRRSPTDTGGSRRPHKVDTGKREDREKEKEKEKGGEDQLEGLNRRERRRLMRASAEAAKAAEEEEDGGGFFEGL